jgi:hypothetical protein
MWPERIFPAMFKLSSRGVAEIEGWDPPGRKFQKFEMGQYPVKE